ncbi:hypothetical protein BDZ94DRAFT_1248418 [Collybia nuda]|uniref:Uncharacterized protein n=1 Tax=Collybia nuda TaxID=64659 RepID=A0A9P5YEU1_9AGAR|nr:hypothetical protein BDZ94DRAFT_1248418 [Collybia nuda]
MTLNPLPFEGDPKYVNHLLEKIMFPFIRRLQVASISLNCLGLSRLLNLPLDSFENLQKISIWVQDWDDLYLRDAPTSVFMGAPNLCEIYFSDPVQFRFKLVFP